MGETPLTLELPKNESSYISVETPEGSIGSAILRDSSLVRGGAQFTSVNDYARADFLTAVPVSEDEKKVEKARNRFYASYGAFWFILPAAMIAGGVAGTYEAVNHDVGTWSTVRMGSNIAWGAALGITLYQVFRYLRVSKEDSTPIVKVPPKDKQ
jgi:hypothetical protein